ncbi:1-(5-phosphoribosyl)-5-amino-4-imidazole-carboxyl ate carboxylase [Kaistia sp. 32K]|uniref:nickel pincer cofactor biosynthesis protein LarB n=1 Tax=Kaistia sp. 32K TaxID=2795690 RepID=UPI0019166F14|nr:nickel pincer cofactor biosynthesis protein LarB [Kaistia sp. 32K]BCP55235.1 1-(5-phosphoribosyl)-5-amino-4-imidazole-carboxyl ate carboxylase [Kaistia sp. 32K]
MSASEVIFDHGRAERIGLDEAVFCEGKSAAQIATILDEVSARGTSLLLTRLDADKFHQLPPEHGAALDFCALSRTAYFGPLRPVRVEGRIVIVAAGTSDAAVAREAARTLRHAGIDASMVVDVGVAGIWRLMARIDEIRRFPIVIAVAGMDAAIASVLGGLVQGTVICVPTSVGYGAAESGRTALNAMLSSCAPGLLTCNIDSGYGAACAAIRILNSFA